VITSALRLFENAKMTDGIEQYAGRPRWAALTCKAKNNNKKRD
jgi:hypothetical protein